MMHYISWTILVVVGLFLALHFAWRYASRRWSLPCPTLLSWAVDGPLVDAVAGTDLTLDRMGLRPGMTVVEIGPGPGRLLLRAAVRVLPGGKAIGVEIQQGMIDKLRRKLLRDDPGNVEMIRADATQQVLPIQSADLVFLCTVLGEIPDRIAALRNCFEALKPGGRLSVTENIFDPHYQSRSKVRQLTEQVGFESESLDGNWRMYTANFRKPGARETQG
ncbi:MAG: methyltransferase domain-containing protein [Planctomycetia bacterium]|nr:methyltransferase domain-containing protein [Planctomycetia bacterium]